jgi:riboflavin synthase alpha subunit
LNCGFVEVNGVRLTHFDFQKKKNDFDLFQFKREFLICFCFGNVHFEKFFELMNKTVDFNNLNNFYHHLTINLGHAMGDNANFSLTSSRSSLSICSDQKLTPNFC